MNIKITGANGYIGKNLISILRDEGHSVSGIARKKLYASQEELREQVKGADAIINLAGAPILQRWNTYNRVSIYNSRVLTTKNLCDAINSLPPKQQPKVFISASAIAIYNSNMVHDEESKSLSFTFPGKVVMDWEEASRSLNKDIRRVIFRIGIVLGKESQTIRKILPVYKLGLGGAISTGTQPFSFIHIDDALKAFKSSIQDKSFNGVYNLVAPEQINYNEFNKTLAQLLKRPAFFSIPGFVLKLIYGEASQLLTEGPSVNPKRLVQTGFQYKYPAIKETLQHIIS